MKITIDTKEDSHEEIHKAIRLLTSLVEGKEVMSNQVDMFGSSSDTNQSSDIFGDDSNSSQDSSGPSESSGSGDSSGGVEVVQAQEVILSLKIQQKKLKTKKKKMMLLLIFRMLKNIND